MDLRLVEIFCCVYEQQSFSRAAKKLYLTQPTVSDHIKTLEEYFGTRLFDRLGKSIQPTKAGEVLYGYGKKLLDVKKAAIEGMKSFLQRLEGELLVGASTIPGEYILPALIHKFRKRYSGISVLVKISDTRGVLAALTEGTIELGFVGAQVGNSHLEFKRFASDELILVAARAGSWQSVHSMRLGDLKEQPLIIREPGSGTRMMFEKTLSAHGYDLRDFNVVAQIGSTNGIKEAVKAGIGLSVLSSRSVEEDLQSRKLKNIVLRDVKKLPRDFFIVSDKRKFKTPICQAFLDFCLSASPGRHL
jgi:DNA-binding transcriptional LysR family regulator